VQREVEVKFQVDNADTVMARFLPEGVVWSEPVLQDDQAFAPSDWTYGMSKIGVSFARLRTEGERHVFTVKTPQSNEMDCMEYETFVSDRAMMHAAVIAMGFAPTVRIVKKRRTATWSTELWGDATLCIDDVRQIGTFLELEIITEDNPAHAQGWLDRCVRDLGIEGTRVTDTYDTLVRNALLALDEGDFTEELPARAYSPAIRFQQATILQGQQLLPDEAMLDRIRRVDFCLCLSGQLLSFSYRVLE